MKTSVQLRAGPAWREFPVLLIKMLLQTEATDLVLQTVTRPAELIVQIFFPRQPTACFVLLKVCWIFRKSLNKVWYIIKKQEVFTLDR